MEPRNVVLIGFMGAGKSAVGRALAEQLSFTLFDTDQMIVDAAGMSIPEIFAGEGEAVFRAHEEDAVLRACAGAGRVIACGGGALTSLKSYGILEGAGVVVYLRAPADVLRARVGGGEDRPMLSDDGAFDRILAERIPVYESAADIIVDADAGSPADVATAIREAIESRPDQERIRL